MQKDTCRFCDEALDSVATKEWRVNVAYEGDEPEWEWKSYKIKKYACGTVQRDGDISEDERRVSIGDGCVELPVP